MDYFPLLHGLQPVLPMSAQIRWTGDGAAPASLAVAEFVTNTALSAPALERELDFPWNGHAVEWERDGHLVPGKYAWRIVLHDRGGKVLAAAEQRFSVDFPQDEAVMLSSVVLSERCEADARDGMRRRAEMAEKDRESVPLSRLDPLRVDGCRQMPEPTGSYPANAMLHAFVRLYPAGRMEKVKPEAWTVQMIVRSASGAVEMQQPAPLRVDGGGGFVASARLAFRGLGTPLGEHVLEAHVRGPGIHKEVVERRGFAVRDAR